MSVQLRNFFVVVGAIAFAGWALDELGKGRLGGAGKQLAQKITRGYGVAGGA